MSQRAAIAKVKIAAKELCLDDDTYRAMLTRITGRSSAAHCNEAQLGLVLDEMKAKGWKPRVVQLTPCGSMHVPSSAMSLA